MIKDENEYLRTQFLLPQIGINLRYDVFVALNDKHKSLDEKIL